MSGPESNLLALISVLAKSLEDASILEIEVIPKDSEDTFALDMGVERTLQGMFSAVVSKQLSKTSFAGVTNPTDLGYTAILAECALAYCRTQGSHAHQLEMIPQRFVGSRGATRFLTSTLQSVSKTVTKQESAHIVGTLAWLINAWASLNVKLGEQILKAQKIAWKEVEKRSYSFQKRVITDKRTKKKIEVLQRESVFRPSRNPFLGPYEKQVATFLSGYLFSNEEEALKSKWSSITSEEQHSIYSEVVRSLKQVDNQRKKTFQTLHGNAGRRKAIYQFATGLTLNKRGKESNGAYLNRLSAEWSKVNVKNLSEKIKIALHPNNVFKGTPLMDILMETQKDGAKQSLIDYANHRKNPGIIHVIKNMEESWATYYSFDLDTYGEFRRAAIDTLIAQNPFSALVLEEATEGETSAETS